MLLTVHCGQVRSELEAANVPHVKNDQAPPRRVGPTGNAPNEKFIGPDWVEFKDVDPVSATGQGGRQQRVEDQYGHIYDHFTIQYEFPNNARAFIFCRQQQGCSNDVSDHVLGTKGFLRQTSGRLNMIEAGDDRWKYEGPKNDMYQTEHDEFFASLREGKPLNYAEKLAHSEADLHRAVELIRSGCAFDTAVEILV